mmetsp:Transcript_26028/g.68342  ORF Transcript_26028/g.68342 Transcript_26028/m.68342 type:complete len:296 (+) Transcript_26028:2126-3013(+)
MAICETQCSQLVSCFSLRLLRAFPVTPFVENQRITAGQHFDNPQTTIFTITLFEIWVRLTAHGRISHWRSVLEFRKQENRDILPHDWPRHLSIVIEDKLHTVLPETPQQRSHVHIRLFRELLVAVRLMCDHELYGIADGLCVLAVLHTRQHLKHLVIPNRTLHGSRDGLRTVRRPETNVQDQFLKFRVRLVLLSLQRLIGPLPKLPGDEVIEEMVAVHLVSGREIRPLVFCLGNQETQVRTAAIASPQEFFSEDDLLAEHGNHLRQRRDVARRAVHESVSPLRNLVLPITEDTSQ